MKYIAFLIGDKMYKEVPEEDPYGNSCSGCVFNNPNGCNEKLEILSEHYNQPRSCEDIIYKEIKEIIKGKKKLLIL